MMPQHLRSTRWLSERLGLSITTLERMRTQQPEALPPHIKINRSIRYDEQVVEHWIKENHQGGSVNG